VAFSFLYLAGRAQLGALIRSRRGLKRRTARASAQESSIIACDIFTGDERVPVRRAVRAAHDLALADGLDLERRLAAATRRRT